MKRFGVLFILLFFAQLLKAQEPTDCINAIGVCSNSTLSENSNGSGINDFDIGNNESACLLQEEHQSVWLYIRIESGSTLGFDITPKGPGEDFDFAVYGPNLNCNELGRPIRCSYAAFSCTYCPKTGLNSTETDLSEGLSGDGYLKMLDVNPGETYFVLVDNFIASDSGFILEWTGNASLDCEITFECPTVDLGNDTSICVGQTTEIGIGPVPSDSYLWSTGATTSLIDVSTPGMYWLEVQRGTCTRRDTIVVTQSPSPTVELGPDQTLCDGESTVLNAFNSSTLGYLWQDGSTQSTFTASEAGQYSVEVFINQCSIKDSVTIEYISPPAVSLPDDTSICNGTSYQINPAVSGENVSYQWQDNSTQSIFTVNNGGIYYVEAQNQCGLDSDTIEIQYVGCGCDVFLPSAFTPNQDGYNDVYLPIVLCDSLTEFNFEIYNRFGEKVYESKVLNEGWDALNVTKKSNQGLFSWYVFYKYIANGVELSNLKKGTVSVIK